MRSQRSNLLTSPHEATRLKSPKLQKDKETSDDKACVVIITKVSKKKTLLCILTTCSSHGNDTHLLVLCNHRIRNNKLTFSEPILVVFPKRLCSRDLFCLRKITKDLHTFAYVNTQCRMIVIQNLKCILENLCR